MEMFLTALALIGIGLAFRPLGWMAAAGALMLIVLAVQNWWIFAVAALAVILFFAVLYVMAIREYRAEARSRQPASMQNPPALPKRQATPREPGAGD